MTVQYEYFFKLLISAFFFIFSTTSDPSANKLSKDIWNKEDIRIRLSISGVVFPVSQLDIVLLLTKSWLANSTFVTLKTWLNVNRPKTRISNRTIKECWCRRNFPRKIYWNNKQSPSLYKFIKYIGIRRYFNHYKARSLRKKY